MARHVAFLRRIPDRAICDSLLEAYFSGMHPIMPLVHAPSFKQRYKAMWTTESQLYTGVSMRLVALMLSMLYGDAVVCPERIEPIRESSETPEGVATSLQELALQAIQLSYFPRYSEPT